MKPEQDENIMKIDNACLTILRKCSLLSDITAAPYFKAGDFTIIQAIASLLFQLMNHKKTPAILV